MKLPKLKKTLILTLIVAVSTILFPAIPSQEKSEKDKVTTLLKQWVDEGKKSVGVVAGLIDSNGSRIYCYGKMGKEMEAVGGDTLFEIGSITKVFTSLVLADMAEKGKLKITDPVSRYLPPDTKLPSKNGKEITFLDLATHTSGLPRVPGNFVPANFLNPYADYTEEKMFQFLSSYILPREIGEQFEYSNLGAGFLGYILAGIAGTDYETLVRKRILAPLDMTETMITVSPGFEKRFARGHSAVLFPMPHWDFPALAGAGALRSTVRDMLKFAGAELGLTDTPLKAAMEETHKKQRQADQPGNWMGLGWILIDVQGNELHVHDGGTGGFRSFLALDLQKRRGVIVLANAANDLGELAIPVLQSVQGPATVSENKPESPR